MAATSELLPMDITNSRIFAASRQSLFGAFADPDQLKLWWGPDGFTNTIHAFDFRPGGTWHFTMHAPDGGSFENTCTFSEIVPNERIVFVHHLPMHVFTMTMTFAADPAGAAMHWHMLFEPAESNETLRPFIVAGNEQNFDRLASHLSKPGAKS